MKCCLRILVFVLMPVFAASQKDDRVVDSLKLLLNKEKNDSARAMLLLSISDEYRYGSPNLDSAFYYNEKLTELAKKTGSRKNLLKANEQKAGLYNVLGNYPEAINQSLENIKQAEALRDSNALFFIRREIMWTYASSGDFSKSLEMAKELLALSQRNFFVKSARKDVYELIAYHNLANIYAQVNKPDSALMVRKFLYPRALQLKNPQGLALLTGGLADSYSKLNMTDSAIHYLRLELDYASQARRTDLKRDARLGLAGLFRKTNQTDSALCYASLGLDDSRNIPDTVGIMDAALLISHIYEDRRQFDSAYHYLSFYHDLKEKSLALEKMERVQKISFNELIHQKQLDQEKKEAEQQYKARVKMYLLIAGLIAFVIIAFILYRNNLQKQKAKTKIENALADLQSTQKQLIHAEKMASLGELTAGIAHEIQNPLNFVNNFSELNKELLHEMNEEINSGNFDAVKAIAKDISDNEEKISHHGKRADAIVKGMLQHSRTGNGQKEPADINELADEYLRLAYHGLRAKDKTFNATFKTDLDSSIGKINIVPQDIGRVLLNLFTNAFYSVTEKQKRHPENYNPFVSVTTKNLNGSILITVRDNGMGIPQQSMEKIFQPFFTTKPTGVGTGLGLSLSYDIVVKGHNGEINAETKEGEFAEFRIKLPRQ